MGTGTPHHKPRSHAKQKPLAKLLSWAVAHATPLSLALVLVAAAAPAALPLLERKLDFEESGPLAGSARPTIRTTPGAEARFEAASRAAEALLPSVEDGNTNGNDAPRRAPGAFFAALARELEARGLEVSRPTRWRSDWPYGRTRGRRCAALHAVLRAPRGDGKESVAIVTPVALQREPRSLARQTRGDAALALAAAHALVAGHLRDAAPWLAKDVVWIIPDASCGSTEAVGAWLEAYHLEKQEEEEQYEDGEGSDGGDGDGGDSSDGSEQQQHQRRRPFVRAGVVQQALVLQAESGAASPDAATPSPFLVTLGVVGADGQLPKTDFYWLVRYYCSKWVRLPGCAPPGYPGAPPGGKADAEGDGLVMRALAAAAARLPGSGSAAAERARAYARRLALVLRFAGQQARGVPTGPHAPFKWRNTDALTITFSGAAASHIAGQGQNQPRQRQRQRHDPSRARQAAELLELSVRSCSVLVERLHHAFFLYALSSPDHFVSVERYIGPACALIGVLVLQAAAARQRLSAAAPVEGEEEATGSGDDDDDDDDAANGNDNGPPASASWAASARVAVLLPLACGALGWSLRAGLETASLAPQAGLWEAAPVLLFLRQAAAAGAALVGAAAAPGGGNDDGADALGRGYALAEGLRLASLAAGLAVLAWVGLAEGGAAVQGLLSGGRRRSAPAAASGRGANAGKRRGGGPATPPPPPAPTPLDWRMLKVLMLSGAAVPLAGMACANWALAHAVALACAPLAFAAPSSSSSSSSSSSQRRQPGAGRGAAAWARIAAVALCSPPGLAALAALVAALVAGPAARSSLLGAAAAAVTAPAGLADGVRWLVLEGTSWATWSFAWCVYAPLWVASAWITSLPCC